MIHILFGFLNRKISYEKIKETKAIIYRDELDNIKMKSSLCQRKTFKKSVRFVDSKDDANLRKEEFMKGMRCIDELGERERMNIRVKVKMTKEEATRLLSKCNEGGVFQFNDVVHELVALPMDRVTILST